MGRRQKGTGTIRKRADGRYEGRVIIGYDDEGNQKVKTVTSKLRREVVEKMEAVRKENIIPLKGLKKDMPFAQWMDFWYQYYTKNSIRETTQVILILGRYIAIIRCTEIARQIIYINFVL